MVGRIKIAPPNSVVLIMDAEFGDVPQGLSSSVVLSTSSCVAVGCLSEADGLTEISLEKSGASDLRTKPSFDGFIETPRHKIAVCTVLRKAILEEFVSGQSTRVRVWVNDSHEPDKIVVAVD